MPPADPIQIDVVVQTPWWAILVQLFSGFVALAIALWSYFRDRRRDRRTKDALPRQQASLIVWDYRSYDMRDASGRPRGIFTIKNGSTTAITNVRLTEALGSALDSTQVELSIFDAVEANLRSRPWLLPGEKWVIPVSWVKLGTIAESDPPVEPDVMHAQPEIWWWDQYDHECIWSYGEKVKPVMNPRS